MVKTSNRVAIEVDAVRSIGAKNSEQSEEAQVGTNTAINFVRI
jgi:hypothetical protein